MRRMRRLVCAFVVSKSPKQVFSHRGPYIIRSEACRSLPIDFSQNPVLLTDFVWLLDIFAIICMLSVVYLTHLYHVYTERDGIYSSAGPHEMQNSIAYFIRVCIAYLAFV